MSSPREHLRVAVDLDNTIGAYTDAFRTSVAGQLDQPVHALNPDPDYAYTAWGVSDSFSKMHAFAVGVDRMFRTMPVFDHASQAMSNLDAGGAHLSIVTSRLCVVGLHETTLGDTVYWLDQVAQVPYHELHALRGRGWSKTDTVMFDVLIDDKPEEVLAARAAGKIGIVFGEYNYNVDVPGPRLATWENAADYIFSLAQGLNS